MLEAKQSPKGGDKEVPGQPDLAFSPTAARRRGAGRAWDVADAECPPSGRGLCARPGPSHGWPPFVLVCDVGHCIEVYADFTGQGKNYAQFPDRQSFRIYLEDLRTGGARPARHDLA